MEPKPAPAARAPRTGDAIAAIDVGTNSVHLVVARVAGAGRYDVVTQEKSMVRLGSGAGDMKHLAPDAIDRGVAALARLRRVADAYGAPVRAVATSAVREAENADEFLRRAHTDAGVDVEVISGTEEARLIHLGVLQALDVFDRRILVCDIGGGSTELVVGERGDVLASRSFKVGAIRLTERFFRSGRARPGDVEGCRQYVRAAISPFVREATRLGHRVAVASSGTAEAVVRLAHAARGLPEPVSWNGTEVTRSDVDAVVERLVRAETLVERRRLGGLDPKRADIIVAGSLILQVVLAELGVQAVTYSSYALREGVLLDTLERSRGGSLHHLRELSRKGAADLARLCDEEPEHSAQVARLALALFDATAPLHGLDEGWREYLEAAAVLANVGLFISHARHHLHSYYIIRNSERLVGFTDREVELIALLARYHRKSAPKPSHPEFARLWPTDQRGVRVAAGILRVAIGLDRSHTGVVRSVDATWDARTLRIVATGPARADLSLEQYTADSRKDLLAESLRRAVEVHMDTEG